MSIENMTVQCGIRDATFDCFQGKGIPKKIEPRYGIGKESDIQGEQCRTFGARDSLWDQVLPFQTLFQKIILVVTPEDS